MGLFDKLKNLFTDEEIIEEIKEVQEPTVEEEPKKKLPTIMRDFVGEEKEEEKPVEKQEDEEISEHKMVQTRAKFSFPIEFDESEYENTFVGTTITREKVNRVPEPVKEVPREVYQSPKPEPKRFTASPIISPVYGILDKNYRKDEVKEKNEDEYEIKRLSKKPEYETIRQKAFGSLTDDLRNAAICDDCEYLKEAQNRHISSDDLLYDMTVEKPKEDNLEDFGISYNEEVKVNRVEPTKIELDVNLDVEVEIENELKNSYKESELRIVNHNTEAPTAEKIETKDPEVAINTKNSEVESDDSEPVELTDDLFNLIDAMYEDKEMI